MPLYPRCAEAAIKKDGKVGATQRYRCHTCRRTFIVRTGTPFAGHRWPQEVIVTAVRWYLRFRLSAADVRDLLAGMCQDSDEGWWDRSYSGSVGALVATRRRTMCPVCTAPRPRRWNSPAAPPSASARSAAVDAAGSAMSGQEHRSTTSSTRLTLCSSSCCGACGTSGACATWRSCSSRAASSAATRRCATGRGAAPRSWPIGCAPSGAGTAA